MKTSNKKIELTTTEIQILNYVKSGFSSAQIANVRNCSIRTIEKHRSNIITKLNLPSTQNALLLWVYKNSTLFKK